MDWQQTIAELLAVGNEVEVGQEYLGYQHRPLGWRNEAWNSNHWYQFLLIDRGEVHLGADGVVLTGGDFCLRGPRHVEQVDFKPDVRYWEIWFTDGQADSLCGQPACVAGAGGDGLRSLVECGLVDLRRHPTQAGRLLLSLLVCKCLELAATPPTFGLSDSQRMRLLRWVRGHLASQPTPDALARVVGLTPDYFTRLFRQSFGMPPRRWLVSERIRAVARALTDSDRPLAEIAALYGFQNMSHFGRQFKAIMGLTPARWRRQYAQPASRYADAEHL